MNKIIPFSDNFKSRDDRNISSLKAPVFIRVYQKTLFPTPYNSHIVNEHKDCKSYTSLILLNI